jgi:1-deoxy-D-xylulose-5-phosphate synthase
MSIAARLAGEQRQVVSIIGDGAMTAGIAFEALNHAAETKADLLVVLNDNDMSISDNVGGLSRYLTRMLSSRPYLTVRAGGEKFLAKLPRALDLARRAEEHVKGMVMPGTLFEELGFTYFGPLDGHDLAGLVRVLAKLKQLGGPRLVHVLTQKGKGFAQAEADPIGYHALAKIQPLTEQQQASDNNKIKHLKPLKYCQVFGRWLCDMAEQEPKLVGITPAMKEGSDLIEFAQRFPQRYFDVAIAEQHSVTLAAGLACGGLKPVVAIYSTFLQRGYDQLIHDVAIQNLDVLFAIDRAGLVGEDGETHMGAFDISYLRCIPNLVLMTPADENQTRQMLYTGFCYPGPAAVRYPRGTGPGVEVQSTMDQLPLGKGVLKRTGQRVALLVFGTLFKVAEQVADSLDSSLADMRFVKPLDTELIDYLAAHHQLLVTLEENVIAGGAGSAVNEYLLQSNHSVAVLNLGLPDRFIIHGSPAQQQQHCGLDKAGISAAIQAKLA